MLTPISFNPQELRLIFPNSQRLNRGNYVMSQLIQACRANEVTDLILVHEHRGEPGMPWKVFPFNCKMFQILLMQDLSKWKLTSFLFWVLIHWSWLVNELEIFFNGSFNLFFEYCQLAVFFNQYCRYLLFNCKLEFINPYSHKYMLMPQWG